MVGSCVHFDIFLFRANKDEVIRKGSNILKSSMGADETPRGASTQIVVARRCGRLLARVSKWSRVSRPATTGRPTA